MDNKPIKAHAAESENFIVIITVQSEVLVCYASSGDYSLKS